MVVVEVATSPPVTPSNGVTTPYDKSTPQSCKPSSVSKSSIPTPKLRRKVSVPPDTLDDTTSVQRLVEYFVVVSCQPRWNTNPSKAASPEPKRVVERQGKQKKDISKQFQESKQKLNNTFKAFRNRSSDVSGTENATRQTFSHDELESREETLPPPKPRGTWRREDSENTNGNIRIPEASDAHTFQPKITARYPATDHVDNPLNPMITQFCYPVGDAVVPSLEYQMPRVHHFVLTNEMGRKVYGTCLTFYEEYCPPVNNPWRRKDFVHDSAERDIEVTMEDEGKFTLYLPRCLCILSIWPYVTAFREYLAQLYRLATATNCMTAPIERYIMNICMEIPSPPPGAFEVQVNILDSVIRFWAPPAKLPIAYVALPYQVLFDCLDVENILHLWYCLTMERNILLVSSQYSLLTVCSEILCSLLYPMKWSHLYVPVLPRFLCPILDAPVPYLCGVTRENWLHVQQFISEETIVVDLDRNNVMFGEKTVELPPVPGKKWIKLQQSLEDIAGHLFWQTRGLDGEYTLFSNKKVSQWHFKRLAKQKGDVMWNEKLGKFDQAFNLQFTPDSKNLRTNESIEKEQSRWDSLQEAFLRFFVAMLKDYRGFLQAPAAGTPLSPTPGSEDWIKWSKRRQFDRDGFLESQKSQYLPYLTQLCATQHFDDFITKRLYSPEMPDIIFFDQSIDAKLNRSRLKFSKVDTPFLQSAKTHKILKTFTAVEPSNDDLPSDGPFIYKSWPETFDSDLFCKPRPIPNIITAEFDRQASLVSRLSQNRSSTRDGDKELLLFYGSDFDVSPEGMAFTVFFFTYSSIIGREWREYQRKRRELDTVSPKATSSTTAETPLEEEISRAVSDLTLGVSDLTTRSCNDCSPTKTPLDAALDCAPCPRYANQQAHDAYNAISQLAISPFAMTQIQIQGSLLDDDEGFAEYEEAREVAVAQLDLAFDTLHIMKGRGHLSDPDIFKSLMEACSRCGDTKRALELIEMMKRDGVADGEVLSCFMAAFCNVDGQDLDAMDDVSRVSDAYGDFLRKKLEDVGGLSVAGTLPMVYDSETDSAFSDLLSDGSEASESSHSRSSLMDWFAPQKTAVKKKKKKKKKRKKKRFSIEDWATSDRLNKQIMLGESLIEFLYPDLCVDTNGDTCPSCSHRMKESEIVDGWRPCEFQDFTTTCSSCQHRFVPKFSVHCTNPSFEGSQGLGTPLFCELLSPWVLRKELNHIISAEDGIDIILNPDWRSGRDINATLWWNLIVMFKRYDLPFSFLLQGSFKNRLINPVPQD